MCKLLGCASSIKSQECELDWLPGRLLLAAAARTDVCRDYLEADR